RSDGVDRRRRGKDQRAREESGELRTEPHGSTVPGQAGVVSVDQTPIRRSLRSNPATYTGLLDRICTAFARANRVRPALFSANSERETAPAATERCARGDRN